MLPSLTTPSKTSSVQRINFIQQEGFTLSYRRMMMGVGAVAAFCLLLFGIQWLRITYTNRQSAKLDVEVKQLREERDRISKQVATIQGEMSARDFLANFFERTTPWTAIFKELAAVMPRSLWLTGVKSPERTDPSVPVSLQLSGRSEEAVSIARFLKALNASSFFDGVILNSSQQIDSGDTTGYLFAVDVSIKPQKGL